MGIAGLWDVLGQGEIVHIAEYARRFYEKEKRPLRIAVDEACWRFNNLTPEQVEQIRQSSEIAAAANPVEKTILWRILRLLRLNIQLIFITDGPAKPWKRNSGRGGLVKTELLRLLHRLFDRLGVPYHQAPGEAEAECARLQQLGIVDAVWSDDGDALMFGARLLVRTHKGPDQKPVKDFIRVYSMDQIEHDLDLDHQSLLVFNLLSGGDYAVKGLQGAGPQAARILSMRCHGLGPIAQTVSKDELPIFREALRAVMHYSGKQVYVEESFPDFKALEAYRNPTISKDFQLLNLRGLKNGWSPPINLSRLRDELRERYNFDTKQYVKHIAPIMLARSLQNSSAATNSQLKITPKRQNKERPGNEIKITFVPHSLFPFDLLQQPPGEDWSKSAKDYNPSEAIECEMLKCLLEQGLPEGTLENALPSSTRKRKAAGNDDEPSSTTKRVEKTSAESNPDAPTFSSRKSAKSKTTRVQQERPAEKRPGPRPQFRLPTSHPIDSLSRMLDLTGGEPVLPLYPLHPQETAPRSTVTKEPKPLAAPGEAIDPAVLRALRERALPPRRQDENAKTSTSLSAAPRLRNEPMMPKPAAEMVIIDLT